MKVSVPLLALALLSACGSPGDDSQIAIDNGNLDNAANGEVEVLPPDESPSTPDNQAAADSNAAAGNAVEGGANVPVHEIPDTSLIPAAMQGRWGLVKNDCDPAYASAAKGLIAVSAGDIRFYESVGRLTLPQTVTANRFVGRFAFSGEGMRWEKVETLSLEGNTLVRTDSDGSFRYGRCA